MSTQMIKLTEQFSRDSLNSAKSGESDQTKFGVQGVVKGGGDLQKIDEENQDQKYVAEVDGP